MELQNYSCGNSVVICPYMVVAEQFNWKQYGHILSTIDKHSKYLENSNQPGNGTQSTSVCMSDSCDVMWSSDNEPCVVCRNDTVRVEKKMSLPGSSAHCPSVIYSWTYFKIFFIPEPFHIRYKVSQCSNVLYVGILSSTDRARNLLSTHCFQIPPKMRRLSVVSGVWTIKPEIAWKCHCLLRWNSIDKECVFTSPVIRHYTQEVVSFVSTSIIGYLV